MSRHYILSTFLRQTSNNLLGEYFQRQGLLQDIDFASLKPRQVEPVVDAINALPDDQRQLVDSDFRDISLLADRRCAPIISDMSQQFYLDLADDIESQSNGYDLAMWLFLNHAEHGSQSLYMSCLRMAQLKNLPFSQARQRKGLPRQAPSVDESTCRGMASAITALFRKQGRGHRCVVEHYRRTNPTRHCYFAFPEDYATSELQYEGDKLVPRHRKSVLEVGFIFSPDTGLLEVGYAGPKKDVEALQTLFCENAFSLQEIPPPRNDRIFHLNGLLDRNAQFPTAADDGIRSVDLLALRLDYCEDVSAKKRSWRRVTVERGTDCTTPLHGLLEKVLRMDTIPKRFWEVTQARFRVTWREGTPGLPARRTFTLTVPDSTDLKDDPGDLVIKRYLPQWNLT